MTTELYLVLGAAFSIGTLHTLIGPDHYLPFIALGKARNWSMRKLSLVTAACGFAHTLGTVILGLLGIYAGHEFGDLMRIESLRGDLAAWALLSFGLLYMLWGVRKASMPQAEKSGFFGPWTLFLIFVLGPCEPLIPLMMHPAASANGTTLAMLVAVYAFATVGTMMAVTLMANAGLARLPAATLARYRHALAGGALGLCGLGMVAFGL